METVLLWEAGISQHSTCGCCLQNLPAPRDFIEGKAQQSCEYHKPGEDYFLQQGTSIEMMCWRQGSGGIPSPLSLL